MLVVKVRKEKKEDQLNKRRSMVTDTAAQDLGVFGSMAGGVVRTGAQQSVISAEIIAENCRDLQSDNPATQLKATQQFRRFLSIGQSPVLFFNPSYPYYINNAVFFRAESSNTASN